MKKLLFFLVALFIGFSINAQNQRSSNGNYPTSTPTSTLSEVRDPIPATLATSTNSENDTCNTITFFPWSEGFESDGQYDFNLPPCWTSYDIDGGGTEWEKVFFPANVHTGIGAAIHRMSNSAQEGWLVTPQIEIPGGRYILEFWSKTTFPHDNEYSGIWVSTTGNDPATSTFVEVHELTGAEISESWKKVTVSLNGYANESIYIGFKYTGNYTSDWHIDDLEISYSAVDFADVEVAAITSPVSGLNLGATDTVVAIVKNNGSSEVTNIDITLNVNGVDEVTEIIASIPAMSQITYTFTQTVDLSAAGNYVIMAYAFLNNDQVPENDTAVITVTNTICGLVNRFPWREGFESASFPPACWSSYDIDGSWPEWQRTTSSIFIHTGGGAATHNLATGAQEGWLITPQLEIPDEGYALEFWSYTNYSVRNEHCGVWVSTTGNDPATATFVEAYQLSGDEISSSWKKITVSLDDYAGDSIYIGFKYMGTNADGWYIDDLMLYDVANSADVEVLSIISPVSGFNLGAADTVVAMIKNNSDNAIANLNITLNVDGDDMTTDVITNVAAFAQITHVFEQTVDLSAAGDHVIIVYTSLENDPVSENDTAMITIVNTVCNANNSFPWTEGFEDGSLSDCWTKEYVNRTTNWTVRTGNGSATGGISTAHTGTYNLSFYHASSTSPATTKLITPPMDITTLTTPALSFWHGQTAWGNDQDELRIYYKTSAAGTWTQLAEFTNDVSAWTKVNLPLPEGSDDYYIAFEGTGKDGRGIVIDDVQIGNFSGVIDAEVLSIAAPVSGVNLTATETVSVVIRNNGSDNISGFPVTLNVNGTDVATETVTDTVAYLSQKIYTFTQTADLSAGGDHVITAYTSLNNDQDTQNDTATITVANRICPIINTFPWEEGFDNGIPECWENIDADGDEKSWAAATSADGEPVINSFSYNFRALTPDNYLITPQVVLDQNYSLQFSVGADDPDYFAEKYSVMVSTTGTNIADFTAIHTETLTEADMKTVVLPLNNYTGNTVYIAFRHWDCTDESALIIDDLKIYNIESLVDAEVVSISHPSSQSGLGTENVKAIIKNNGGADISNFTLTLNVNGTDVATETYTGTIASLDQDEYTFTQSYNFSNVGGYTITVSVNLTNDTESANDTCVKVMANFSAANITLYGYRVHDEVATTKSVISFSSNTPATVTEVVDYTDGSNGIAGGEYYDGHLYLFSRNTTSPYTPANFVKLTTTTWAATVTPVSSVCIDMAYDYSDNVMYGVKFNNNDVSDLYTINIATGEMNFVASSDAGIYTLACNLQGQLFGVDVDGYLRSINKTTAATTTIGYTGIISQHNQSMAFDHTTGRLFWTMKNEDGGKLIEIDPTNGAVLDRGTLGGNAEVVALYTPYIHSIPIDVYSLFPERDATGVEPTATIRITFDGIIEGVDLSGVTISPDPGSVSASATGAVLTIAHDDFDHDTRYTVTVPAGAIDNYTSDSPITWSFTVKGSGVSTIDLKAINMYPNPAKNQVQLTNLPEKSEITVYDVTGRVVKTCKTNDSSFTMSVDFAPGTYFVKIENNNASTVKKLIVE